MQNTSTVNEKCMLYALGTLQLVLSNESTQASRLLNEVRSIGIIKKNAYDTENLKETKI